MATWLTVLGYRAPQDRQQRLAHLAGGQTEHEAGQDHAVERRGAARIGAHHRDRRKPPSARHRQLDLAQLAQQMAPVGAVAPVGLVEHRHALQMLVNRASHLVLHDAGKRLPA